MPKRSDVKKLYNGGVPNASTTVYTAPTGKEVMITSLVFHNSNGASATVEVWHTVASGSNAYSNKLLKTVILTDATYTFTTKLMMNALDELHMVSSIASAVSVFINGMEITTI